MQRWYIIFKNRLKSYVENVASSVPGMHCWKSFICSVSLFLKSPKYIYHITTLSYLYMQNEWHWYKIYVDMCAKTYTYCTPELLVSKKNNKQCNTNVSICWPQITESIKPWGQREQFLLWIWSEKKDTSCHRNER